MIRIAIDSLETGMRIAKPIISENGQLILGRGVTLNHYFVERIRNMGIPSLYIENEDTEDIIPQENISEMVRGSTLKDLRELTGPLDDIQKEMKSKSFTAVKEAVTSDNFKSTFRKSPGFTKLIDNAGKIVDDLLAGETTLGLNSIKTYDNYTFQHSIDVTIVSIMIGRKIGLERKRLLEIGTGCLLHDIGKTFMPLEIINKPGKLTDEEFRIMKDHPIIGYELTKDVPTIGILPPHIAFQHHEKQDGSGYPRNLQGNNTLDLSVISNSIHLYGSIAAVADIYDALSSDRPYRKALPPDKVIKIMRDLFGTHLNRGVLKSFLAIAPVYPVGTSVVVKNDQYRGYFGIVAKLNPDNFNRPCIRLIFDPQKKKIDPTDINLLEYDQIEIQTVIL